MNDRRPLYHPPPPGYSDVSWQAELMAGWLMDALRAAKELDAPAELVAAIEAALAKAQRWEAGLWPNRT